MTYEILKPYYEEMDKAKEHIADIFEVGFDITDLDFAVNRYAELFHEMKLAFCGYNKETYRGEELLKFHKWLKMNDNYVNNNRIEKAVLKYIKEQESKC